VPLKNHDLFDVFLSELREARKFRRHPAEIAHHPARRVFALCVGPIGKCEPQIKLRRLPQLWQQGKNRPVTEAAKPRATVRGMAPNAFKISQTAAYSSHSFIVIQCGQATAGARQYARGAQLEDRGSMLDFPFRDRISYRHR
jgi:hypothetical protein